MPFYTTQATTTDDINTVVTSPGRLYTLSREGPHFPEVREMAVESPQTETIIRHFVSWIIWSINGLCVSNHESCLWPFHPQHTRSCLLLHPCTNQGVHSILIMSTIAFLHNSRCSQSADCHTWFANFRRDFVSMFMRALDFLIPF